MSLDEDATLGDSEDDSSDEEFFDPEGSEDRFEPPSPSWLTRALSDKSSAGAPSTGGERTLAVPSSPAPANPADSPTPQAPGSLDVSQLVATMPSASGSTGEDDAPDAPGSSRASDAARAASASAELTTRSRSPLPEAPPAFASAPSPDLSGARGDPLSGADADAIRPPLARDDVDAGGSPLADPSEAHDSRVMRIKDLDTGREYILDEAATDSVLGAASSNGVANPGAGTPQPPPVVRDARTGRELSVREFEDSVGLSPLAREMRLRERRDDPDARDDPGSASRGPAAKNKPATVVVTAPAEKEKEKEKKKSKPFGRNPARWLEKRLGEAAAFVEKSTTSVSSSSSRADAAADAAVADDPATRAVRAAALAAAQSQAAAGPGPSSGGGGDPGAPLIAGREPAGSTVRTHARRKAYKEYTELRLAQTLRAHEDAVWTMKFSHRGEFLATAGQDRVVRVWALDATEAEDEDARTTPERDDGTTTTKPSAEDETKTSDGEAAAAAASGSGARRRCLRGDRVFLEKPHREYRGHKGDVLDLCWSRTNWLLSSSMDKTVRLWYATMDECLRVFAHQDFVTAIDFHPINDKYFLSGSLDGKLRFWNIPDHAVADWVDIGEMVTAASFRPDGEVAVAGSYRGVCHFYGVDGVRFEYVTTLDVRNARARRNGASKGGGKKITGLSFMPGDDQKLLVTSNDSRIRVYDGYELACKYKGHKNNNSQIRASFSPGAEFIVCGSEDENVYVWSTINSFVPSINPIYTGYRRDKHASVEHFAAQSDIATVALFAPNEVRDARAAGDSALAKAVREARRAVKSNDTRATKAAAALFGGGAKSPMSPTSPTSQGQGRGGGASPPAAGDPGGERANAVGNAASAPANAAAAKAKAANGDGGVPKATALDARAEARAEGERAFAAGMAVGQIIVTAGYSGEIRIFENVGTPRWL